MSAKIAEELAYEKDAAIEEEPNSLKEFKKAGIWTVCFFSGICWLLKCLVSI